MKKIINLILISLLILANISSLQATTIKGRVIDRETKKPLKNVYIEVKNAYFGVGFYKTKTDTQGEFSFKNIEPGKYYKIYAYKEGYYEYEKNYWRIDEDKETIELKITLGKSATIAGTIRDSKGKPVVDARILIRRSYYGKEYFIYTDKKGEFSVSGLKEGRYRMDVEKTYYVPERIHDIRASAGKTKTVDVTLYKGGSISGKIYIKGLDQPAPRINIKTTGKRTYTISTAYDGSFFIGNVIPGEYTLTAYAEGFHEYKSKKLIRLSEGREKKNLEYNITLKDPEIKIRVYREVFLPGEKITLPVQSFRINEIDFTLYKVEKKYIIQKGYDFRKIIQDDKENGLQMIKKWKYSVKKYSAYRWVYNNIDLPADLKPGSYIFKAKSGKTLFIQEIQITDLGIVAKRSLTKLLIFANNFKSNIPTKDVSIYLIDKNNKYWEEKGWFSFFKKSKSKLVGKTDKDGIFVIKLDKSRKNLAIIGVTPDGSMARCNSSLSYKVESETYTIFSYTDRPVYRAGHSVYFKSIIREIERNDFFLKPGEKAKVTVYDAKGSKYFTKEYTLNSFGSINGMLKLGETCSLGRYRIEVKYKTGKATRYFYVEQYRKPEFYVEIKSDKPYYVQGDDIKFIVSAKYYFGSPIANKEVKYAIYESKIQRRRSYWWYDDYDRGYERLTKSGKVKTDKEGMAVIDYLPKKEPYDKKITIVVDVIEEANRKVSASTSVNVGKGLFYIQIDTDQYVYWHKDKCKIKVVTKDFENNPVSTSVKIELLKHEWNSYYMYYSVQKTPIYVKKVKTDAAGQAEVVLDKLPGSYGRLEIKCSSVDKLGNKIDAVKDIWIYRDSDNEFSYNYQSMEVYLDRIEYSVGEKAKILINTRYDNT